MTAAAIMGSFTEYRMVKTRSTFQLIIEIPIEQQAQAFAALGYPIPGTDIPVAVARMNSPAGKSHQPNMKGVISADGYTVPNQKPSIPPAGELQRQRYASMSPAEQAVTRAALLPKDERFRAWVDQQLCPGSLTPQSTEATSIRFIQSRCCSGNSRRLIAEVPEYLDRFLAMELEFRMDVGEVARPR